jgi:hypothetical protein
MGFLPLGRNIRRLECWLRRMGYASVPSGRFEASALKQDIKFSFHVLSNSVFAKIQTVDAIDCGSLILSLSYRSVLSEMWSCHLWHLLFWLLLHVSFLFTVIPHFTYSQRTTFRVYVICRRCSTLTQERKFAHTSLKTSSSCSATMNRSQGWRSC